MTRFNWTGSNELGHAAIDYQHKRLLLQAIAVVEPLTGPNELKPGAAHLQALIDFCQEHFAFEEGLMRSTGYPKADQHVNYHAALLDELRKYCSKVQADPHANPVEFIDFLWYWLALRINRGDGELVLWLNSHGDKESV